MARQYQAQDSDEFWHDTDAEQGSNQQLYGVISGCVVTDDGADLTMDLALGEVLHNGDRTAVAAATNAVTLVADGSNERWAYLTVSSAGAPVLVSGDPAANGSTEPTKPELGDRVWIRAYKIEAAQTITTSISVRLDKRIPVATLDSFTKQFFRRKSQFLYLAGSARSTGINGDPIGAGWRIIEDTGGTIGDTITSGIAYIRSQTGTTVDSDVGISSTAGYDPQNDPVMYGKVVVPSSANLNDFLFGFNSTGDFDSAQNNFIGFRRITTGNFFTVTDNGGTESAADTGVSATTEVELMVEVSLDGTSVLFTINGTETTVTTNMPTANLFAVCGGRSNATSVNVDMRDIYAWADD